MYSLSHVLPLIVILLLVLAPFAGIAALTFWSATRKDPCYTLERQECRVAPAEAAAPGFLLQVRPVDGQPRYLFLAVGADGTSRPRTAPVQYTALRKTDGPPALLRRTTLKRSGKTENPERDFLIRETYILCVPLDVAIQGVRAEGNDMPAGTAA